MNNNQSANWSKPFHGIQHLGGLKRGFQVSVTDCGSFAECDVFVPGCGFNATETKHDTVELARAHGEAQARSLGARS